MRRYLYFTVFISGMTALAAEFGASRLLQTIYGSSNLVWASIIGLIMVYFAVGYRLGGRWVDRSPHPQTLFGILAWGAFTLGIVPFIAAPVLRAAAAAFGVHQDPEAPVGAEVDRVEEAGHFERLDHAERRVGERFA